MLPTDRSKKVPWLRDLIASRKDEIYMRICSDGYFSAGLPYIESQKPYVHEFVIYRDGDNVNIYRLGERQSIGKGAVNTGMYWKEDIFRFLAPGDTDLLNAKGTRMTQEELDAFKDAFLFQLEDFEKAGTIVSNIGLEKILGWFSPPKNLYNDRPEEIKPVLLESLERYYKTALAEIATGM